jgi:hypothetical protein
MPTLAALVVFIVTGLSVLRMRGSVMLSLSGHTFSVRAVIVATSRHR